MNMQEETWVAIPDYPSYQISTWGRVRNERGRILSPHDKGGYLKTQILGEDKIQRKPSVHRLVAQAFSPQP